MSEKERVAERLRRLRILANIGANPGEREAAAHLFEKLMRKYSFDLTAFDFDGPDSAEKREFRFKGKEEEKILLQTAAKVLNSVKIQTWSRMRNGRAIRNLMIIECTREQKAEISFLFDFYSDLWKREKEKMMSAFIQKHSIAPDHGPDGGKDISAEDLRDLLRRMSVLSDDEPILRLETA